MGAMLPSGLRRRVSDAVEPTRDAVTVHLPRPANDGSYLDRAIGGVASVATVVSGGGAGGVMMNNASRGDWPGIAGVCALRDGSAPGEVRVVAVNADGLLCGTPRITRPARRRWSGSAASTIRRGRFSESGRGRRRGGGARRGEVARGEGTSGAPGAGARRI